MAEPRPELFVQGYLNDRYLRGERPDMREPKGLGLPDAGGRVMRVRTSYLVGAELQDLRDEALRVQALTNAGVQAKHEG